MVEVAHRSGVRTFVDEWPRRLSEMVSMGDMAAHLAGLVDVRSVPKCGLHPA